MTALLDVKGLSAGYGRHTILADVTLPPVSEGCLVALLGANAAGKSTLLRRIAGLAPGHGHIDLDGTPLASLDRHARSRTVAYLPQSLPQPSALLVYETIFAACRAVMTDWDTPRTERAIEGVLERLNIAGLATRRLDTLSGGQRQLVALAQVLVRTPRLLLLDEPTSALDLRHQIAVLDTVRDTVSAGAAAIVAMHDIDLAARTADMVVILAAGRIAAAGTPRSALTSAVIREAYGVEARIVDLPDEGSFVVVDGISQPTQQTEGDNP